MSNNVIILRNTPIALTSNVGRAFVCDCARHLEQLIDNEQLCEKYRLSIENWQQLGSNETLALAIQTELKQRIRSGVSAQEAAAKEFTTAPPTPDDASPSSLLKNHDFITDCARYAEGIISEAAVRKKYHLLREETWTVLGSDDKLVEAIDEMKLQRIRNGQTKREKAQLEIIDGPPILGQIMRNPGANDRHRIDAAKALDSLAAPEPAAAQNSNERFIITINLGNDEKLRFNKSIRPNPNDTDGEILDQAPQELLAIAAASKREGGNGGQPL
jgi:hypothetical protein